MNAIARHRCNRMPCTSGSRPACATGTFSVEKALYLVVQGDLDPRSGGTTT